MDKSPKLTAQQRRGLETVAHITRSGEFDGAHTGRQFRRSTAESLVALGLLGSRMMGVADGDGFIRDGCRPRKGYFLTPEGRDALRHLEACHG